MPSIPSLRGSKAPWPAVMISARVSPDREQLLAVLAQALERLHLLAEVDLRAVLQALLGAELD